MDGLIQSTKICNRFGRFSIFNESFVCLLVWPEIVNNYIKSLTCPWYCKSQRRNGTSSFGSTKPLIVCDDGSINETEKKNQMKLSAGKWWWTMFHRSE